MHLIARPVAAIAPTFDDGAITTAAAAAGIAVSPLSACYTGRRRRHGLILGYAGTPEPAIDTACANLARVLGRAGARMRGSA
jgi:GntR family transcriptional regulator / MocR family aminotransferase